jgi:hypothetical protein
MLWSSILGVRRGANEHIPEISTVTKPSETYGGGPWMGASPTHGCTSSKDEDVCMKHILAVDNFIVATEVLPVKRVRSG